MRHSRAFRRILLRFYRRLNSKITLSNTAVFPATMIRRLTAKKNHSFLNTSVFFLVNCIIFQDTLNQNGGVDSISIRPDGKFLNLTNSLWQKRFNRIGVINDLCSHSNSRAIKRICFVDLLGRPEVTSTHYFYTCMFVRPF